MVVAGSMIGSGVFIVSADIARQVGSAGWLLAVWIASGLLTVAAALAYGELAAMMPQAGGQYVFLREAYSPFWGFLYGWTLFLVIQTGTIAAVAVAFSRFLGVLVPAISPDNWIVPPIDLSASYAVSLSTQQFVGILMLVVLDLHQHPRPGARQGDPERLHLHQDAGGARPHRRRADRRRQLGRHPRQLRGRVDTARRGPDHAGPRFVPSVTAAAGLFGLFVAFCVAQVGSLFSSDAWNNITFTAGEVKDPRRKLPLALAAGTGLVVTLYVLANVAYL